MGRDGLLTDLQSSPACAKVRICLHVKGVAHRRVAPSVGDLVRQAPVPRLVLDGTTVATAGAILRRLEAERPAPALMPANGDARAYHDVLEGWADGALASAVRRARWGPPAMRERTARAVASEIATGPLRALVAALLRRRAARLACAESEAAEALAAHVQVLDTMLAERDYLLGRTATRADFAALAQLACARDGVEAFSLAAFPAVTAWLARLDCEPAIAMALRS